MALAAVRGVWWKLGMTLDFAGWIDGHKERPKPFKTTAGDGSSGGKRADSSRTLPALAGREKRRHGMPAMKPKPRAINAGREIKPKFFHGNLQRPSLERRAEIQRRTASLRRGQN